MQNHPAGYERDGRLLLHDAMIPLYFLKTGLVFVCTVLLVACSAAEPARKPNIILILTDDQGYADVGFNGCRDIPTPHIDRIAREGVRFTNGYVTHPYCAPSRAAIMAGRYQQRFGFEANPNSLGSGTDDGIAEAEVLLPARLKQAGYATGIVGKWHLGIAPPFHPVKRGFDEFFGFLGGSFPYLRKPSRFKDFIVRGFERVDENSLTYLTDEFSREAVAFIRRHREQPFFLYLAYNAPHSPWQATPKYLDRFPHLTGDRQVYAAMISAVDDGVGLVLSELQALGIDENTLVFYLSDNGGWRVPGMADNGKLRGHKGETYEGGIRVPFAMRWPGNVPSGVDYSQSVISLDVHATALAAAGVAERFADTTEGVDLMPFVTGRRNNAPHRRLFWRVMGGWDFAMREGDTKIVKPGLMPAVELFDLSQDIGEKHDLAKDDPQLKSRLLDEYLLWDSKNVPPRWMDPHIENARRIQLERSKH